jgi:hypothetical protein
MSELNKNISPDGIARIRRFIGFFKAYMNVLSLVTAFLPIAVTALGAIATYRFQAKSLSVYTSLYCCLLIAFIFYIRHQLARVMFREAKGFQRFWQKGVRMLPLLLIVGSLYFAFSYHRLLRESVTVKRKSFELPPSEVTDETILANSFESQTPEAPLLMVYYLGVFLTAEAAFALMAMRENLQDVVKLTDIRLINGTKPGRLRQVEVSKVLGINQSRRSQSFL